MTLVDGTQTETQRWPSLRIACERWCVGVKAFARSWAAYLAAGLRRLCAVPTPQFLRHELSVRQGWDSVLFGVVFGIAWCCFRYCLVLLGIFRYCPVSGVLRCLLLTIPTVSWGSAMKCVVRELVKSRRIKKQHHESLCFSPHQPPSAISHQPSSAARLQPIFSHHLLQCSKSRNRLHVRTLVDSVLPNSFHIHWPHCG